MREGDLGRSIDDVVAAVPAERQAKIQTRTAEILAEVDGLRELRRLAEKTQAQLAHTLGVKQPSIVKMEYQADLYLSTLRRFVEAAGGRLEVRVTLPGKGEVRLTGIGEISSS